MGSSRSAIKDFASPVSTGSVWFRLVKVRISLLAAIASFTGYILHSNGPDAGSVVVSGGVFFLACGSGAMNHYQDRFLDCFFCRTNQRPLPQKLISPSHVLLFSWTLIFCGIVLIFLGQSSSWGCLVGLAAVFLYNGLYTPLKQKTNLAIIPGTLCGMMPPLLGWVAAGGSMISPQIIILMTVWGLWQLPHFWLLLLVYQEDYLNSTIPNMFYLFTDSQLKKIIFVWLSGFISMALLLPVVQVLIHPLAHWLLAAGLIFVFIRFSWCLFVKNPFQNYARLFGYLNRTMGFIIALILLDRFTFFAFFNK